MSKHFFYITTFNVVCFPYCRKTKRKEGAVKILSRILFTSILFYLLVGCQGNIKQTAGKVLTFRKENAIDITETDFFKNKTVIQLETNENALIHRLPGLKKDGDNFFIYSRDEPLPVLRFDLKGNFLNTIGSRGQGPNEFSTVFDIFIDKEKSTVELLTFNKIIHFSYDGIPIKSKNFEIPALSFSSVNSYYWFYIGTDNAYSKYRLLQTDEDFKITNEYILNQSNMLSMWEYNFLQSPYHTFREFYNNNIYCIRNDSLLTSFSIKFPTMELPSEVHKMPPIEAFEFLQKCHYAYIKIYLENEMYIYLQIGEIQEGKGMVLYHWIINKRNNYQEKILKVDLFKDPNFTDSYLVSPQLLTEDNFLYFLGYPIEKENDDIDFDLNPSIVIINLKQILQ